MMKVQTEFQRIDIPHTIVSKIDQTERALTRIVFTFGKLDLIVEDTTGPNTTGSLCGFQKLNSTVEIEESRRLGNILRSVPSGLARITNCLNMASGITASDLHPGSKQFFPFDPGTVNENMSMEIVVVLAELIHGNSAGTLPPLSILNHLTSSRKLSRVFAIEQPAETPDVPVENFSILLSREPAFVLAGRRGQSQQSDSPASFFLCETWLDQSHDFFVDLLAVDARAPITESTLAVKSTEEANHTIRADLPRPLLATPPKPIMDDHLPVDVANEVTRQKVSVEQVSQVAPFGSRHIILKRKYLRCRTCTGLFTVI